MLKKKFIVLILFISTSLISQEEIKTYTLPKSGTFLLSNVFEILHLKYSIDHLTDPYGNINKISGKSLINIRDLRDYFISLRNFTNRVVMIGIEKDHEWLGFKPLDTYGAWLSMNDDERLLALITLDPNIPYYESNIINNIITADKYIFQKNCIVTKYEDWVGEKGGGTKKAFFTTLNRVLNFFGWKVDEGLKEKCYQSFYGDSLTFDRGQIGYWKTEFN